ncbi:MAG TPA: hypothetical protein EYO79_03650 [Candidatus Marinimicrobia bacterium]|nr:hypothetical protein [Candidatus Neomarinimicrobiota bacterium]
MRSFSPVVDFNTLIWIRLLLIFYAQQDIPNVIARVNGERIYPNFDGKGIGEIKEFSIPKKLYKYGVIILTFDILHEPDINWRRQSRLSEVWLIKK